MTLTIYSNDFDDPQGGNRGFSGNVFVENGTEGISFSDNPETNLSRALRKISEGGIKIDEVVFNYRGGDGDQMFLKLKCQNG